MRKEVYPACTPKCRNLGRKRGFKTLWLAVNKNNSNSIAWYSRMGFDNVRPIVQDIGAGFTMDDLRLEKAIF